MSYFFFVVLSLWVAVSHAYTTSITDSPYSKGVTAYPAGRKGLPNDMTLTVIEGRDGKIFAHHNPRIKYLTREDYKRSPWNAMGYLRVKDCPDVCLEGHNGTGVVIENRRVILTTAHGVSWTTTRQDTIEGQAVEDFEDQDFHEVSVDMVSYLANVRDEYIDGEMYSGPYEAEQIIRGPWVKTKNPDDDWAIVVLRHPVPEYIEPLKVMNATVQDIVDKYSGRISIAGFSGLAWHSLAVIASVLTTAHRPDAAELIRLNVKGEARSTVLVDADSESGFSGGPLMAQTENEELRVVGLVTEGQSPAHLTLSLASSRFYEALQNVLKNLEPTSLEP